MKYSLARGLFAMAMVTPATWGTENPAVHHHASEAQCQLVPPYALAEELNSPRGNPNPQNRLSRKGGQPLSFRKPGDSTDPDCWLQRECYPGAGTVDDPYILDISAITTEQGISQVGARNIERWALTGVARLNDTLLNSGINNIRAEFRQLMVVPDSVYTFGQTIDMATDSVDFANCQPCRAWVRQAGADLVWVFHPYLQQVGNLGVTGLGRQVAMINLLPDNVTVPEYIIVHEVGHQLGGGHQIQAADAIGTFDYSYGAFCEMEDGSQFRSVVSSGWGGTRVWQFSDPSMPCGMEGVTDNARTVRELGGYRASYSLRPPVTGSVALSVDHTEVDEGDAITVTVSRSGPLPAGASVGLWLDGEQDEPALVSQFELPEWHFIPAYLERDYHYVEFAEGQISRKITIYTTADGQWRDSPEPLHLSLAYPGATELDPTATKVTVQVNNTDPMQRGTVAFAKRAQSVQEGDSIDVELLRTDGSDGALALTVHTKQHSDALASQEAAVSLGHGETAQSITVQSLALPESFEDHTVILMLSDDQGELDRTIITVTNVDKRPLPPPPPPQKSKSGGSLGFGLALLALLSLRRHWIQQSKGSEFALRINRRLINRLIHHPKTIFKIKRLK